MTIDPVDIFKILLAVVFGGLIGLEREFRDKAAGFRTLIFICLGAALFTILSAELSGSNDPTRISASIVTGVGFIGAGVILRDRGRIIGLTTAAMIWLTAAIGMGVGGGKFGLVSGAMIAVMIVLLAFPYVERMIDNLREERTYEIVLAVDPIKMLAIEKEMASLKLKVHARHQEKGEQSMRCTWDVVGPPQNQDRFVQLLLTDPEIKELSY